MKQEKLSYLSGYKSLCGLESFVDHVSEGQVTMFNQDVNAGDVHTPSLAQNDPTKTTICPSMGGERVGRESALASAVHRFMRM